jgi:hypothetical protein
MPKTHIIKNLSDQRSQQLALELHGQNFSVQRKRHYASWSLHVSHIDPKWEVWLILKFR